MKTPSLSLSVCSRLLASVFLLGTAGWSSMAVAAVPPFAGIDRNGNGMSDLFDRYYSYAADPAGDYDKDGVSNLQESIAGSNPGLGNSYLRVIELRRNGARLDAIWQSVKGKTYQLQAASSLSGPWQNEGAAIKGTNFLMSGGVALDAARKYLRIQVSDPDSDSDGLTDWEEEQCGTNPLLPDSDGDGRTDLSFALARMEAPSTVNVYAAKSWAAESGQSPAQFRLTRHGSMMPVSIYFTLGGTAVKDRDYTVSGTSVYFPAGATEALVTVTPLPDQEQEPAETVTLTLTPASSYQPGSSTSASVSIVSNGINGTYYNTVVGTANLADAALTRRDAAIDFDWGKPTGAGVPDPLITADNVWGARWEGFLYPRTSEVYQIHAIADRGAVVWVSTAPITATAGATTGARIVQWTTTSPTTKYSADMLPNSVKTVAGQPLYFRVDYRDSAANLNNANIQLRWSSPTIPEEVIPGSAFSSEGYPGSAPVITSPLGLSGIAGAPFSYQITATNAPASFSASGLPSGLSIDASGLISGTLNAAPGYLPITITAGNAAGADSKAATIYVTQTGGAATREIWPVTGGTGLAAIPVHTAPATTGTLTSLESPDNTGDQFGERIRGYLTPPATGLFTFFLTSDELAELWVSSSDEPAHELKRAWVAGAPAAADGVWDAQASQKSITMWMTAGMKYYFEALRRETTGSDHLAIAWLKPGQTDPAQKEIIPGWALSPWTPPADTVPDGTLYAAMLSPAPGTTSLGSGYGLLRVNAARTAATVSYTYSNLSSALNAGVHIEDTRSIQGMTGRTLYDLDNNQPDEYGNYNWTFTFNSTHSVAEILAAIEGGSALLNLRTQNFPGGEIRGLFAPVAGSQSFVPPPAPPASELTLPADPAASKAEAVRFLQQATFGARHDSDGAAPWDPDSIEAVQAQGYAAWIDAQLALPAGPDPETPNNATMPPTVVYPAPTNSMTAPNSLTTAYYGSGPMSSYIRDFYLRYPRSSTDTGEQSQLAEALWRAWWSSMVKAPDQLRHRMAFALSQILVVSEDGELAENARAVGHYYDLLYYHGLGNFRTLLERVTLNPAMGEYLDMRGNRKPNPATGYIPNENYAREILQLFSIGLLRLHPDGTPVLSLNGLPAPTYEQENIVGFSHTFTGWSYPGSTSNFIAPMTPRATDHATGAKLLLEDAMIPELAVPTTASCNEELAAALDVIFHHPNTGPFICRQLIQRLVTANPSPGYVYRAASVFADDGSGTRGNLAAVARAILLDPEARNQQPRTQPGYGHLKEPVIRATQLLRAFRGFSYAERTYGNSINLGVAIVATQANIDLTQPLPTTSFTVNAAVTPYTVVDGVALAAGNQILVRNQTNAGENGLYRFNGNGTLLVKPEQADEPAEINQAWVKVAGGTSAGKWYRQSVVSTSPGVDAQVWTEVASGDIRRRMWNMGSLSSSLNQSPLRAPTVFNFYEPGYVYLGRTGSSGLTAPEFQITTETSVMSTASWFYDFTRNNTVNPAEPYSAGQGYDHGDPIKKDIKLDLTTERGIAADSGVLVDRIGSLLMPGMMDARLRSLLVTYLETLPEATDGDRMKRVSEALYLISLTPEFTWQK